MKAAASPGHRSPARLLFIDARGHWHDLARSRLPELFDAGDLLVVNDAATLPASLTGLHRPSGEPIEVRLAGRHSLEPDDVHAITAVVFGAGDHRTPTEHRAVPPPLRVGDALALGPLHAEVRRVLGHPRLVELDFPGPTNRFWAGLAAHGRPIQYAHVPAALALWDVWTPIAARPSAFEAPSAAFALDGAMRAGLRDRGVRLAGLTLAAGISSTGDAALDARLPLDEAYELPARTVDSIAATRQRGGRVVALGTTVARALEHAASRLEGSPARLDRAGFSSAHSQCGLSPGPTSPSRFDPSHAGTAVELPSGRGLADQRLGAATRLRVVDAIVSGVHEPGSSHRELLRAFATDEALEAADAALERLGYRSHEFGDSVWVEAARHGAAPTRRLAAALSPART